MAGWLSHLEPGGGDSASTVPAGWLGTALFAGLALYLSLFLFWGCRHLSTETNKAEPIAIVRTFPNPMAAFRELDPNAGTNFQLTEDEAQFKAGLEQILEHHFVPAASAFTSLYRSSGNDSIKKEAVKIIYNLLFYLSEWQRLLDFDAEAMGDSEDEDNIMVLARVLAAARKEETDFGRGISVVEWSPSPSGCPIVPCYINGRLRNFWFDTGANYSVISADIAGECNIFPLVFEQSKARTGTSRKVLIYPAIADSLRIGEMTLRNSPFVIVDEDDLKLRLFGSHSKTKIDGIIGWKAIQHMDVSINFVEQTLTIRKPVDREIAAADRNFFWLGCPVVKLIDSNQTSVIFGLDIGSEKSSITHKIFDKIEFDNIYKQVKPITSVGGSVYFHANLVSQLILLIDNHSVEFSDIGTTYQVPHLFVRLDGILGCDFMKNSIVRLDIRNGKFSFEPILK